jgi:hypothetical protein
LNKEAEQKYAAATAAETARLYNDKLKHDQLMLAEERRRSAAETQLAALNKAYPIPPLAPYSVYNRIPQPSFQPFFIQPPQQQQQQQHQQPPQLQQLQYHQPQHVQSPFVINAIPPMSSMPALDYVPQSGQSGK